MQHIRLILRFVKMAGHGRLHLYSWKKLHQGNERCSNKTCPSPCLICDTKSLGITFIEIQECMFVGSFNSVEVNSTIIIHRTVMKLK